MKNPLRIAIYISYHFTLRDILFTHVWEEMAKRKNVHFILLGHGDSLDKVVSERGCSNISFFKFPPSASLAAQNKSFWYKLTKGDLQKRIWRSIFYMLDR